MTNFEREFELESWYNIFTEFGFDTKTAETASKEVVDFGAPAEEVFLHYCKNKI